MSTVNPQLSNMMYLVGLFALFAGELCATAVLATSNGTGFFGRRITQRQRYTMLIIAQAIIVVALLSTLRHGTIDEYVTATHEWWSTDLTGKVISSLATFALISPMFTVMSGIAIYARPVTFAKSAGHGWFYPTTSWRKRKVLVPRKVLPEHYDPSKARV